MLALRAIVAADGQHPVPSSREHASASASSTSRSFPEVGEFAHTQIITAILTAPASRLSDSGSKTGAAGRRQMRPDAVVQAHQRSLTSAHAREREACPPGRQVVVLDVVGSSPIVHPNIRAGQRPDGNRC
jgi:hypothetical protein